MNRLKSPFPLLLLLLPVFSSAQQNVPPQVRGEMPAVSTEGRARNVLTGGFSVSSAYDDNALNATDNHISDTQFNVAPNIGIQQTRRHFTWSADYSPGFVFSQRFVNRDQVSQALGAGVQFRPTARWSLWARENYSVTTDPFQQLAQDPFLPDLGPLNSPNDSIVTPLAKRTAKLSNAGASYRWSAHTSIGFTGSFSQIDFDHLASDTTTPLLNSRSASGSAFVSHQLSKTQTVGAQYSYGDLRFTQLGTSHTITQSAQLFDQLEITPRSSLYVFVGPEYARSLFSEELFIAQQVVQLPLQSNSWSPTAGASYTFHSERGSVRLSFTRRVSDGGGLVTAVRMNEFSSEFRRQLKPRWSAGVGAGYAINSLANASNLGSDLHSFSAFADLQRELGRNVTLRFSYSLLRQDGNLPGQVQGDHNRAVISIDYHFLRPLGF